jgi:hypothetical protein
VAVTYAAISQFGSTQANNFQVEMFFDGRIAVTYLDLNCLTNLVGLSAGTGAPPAFVESDLTSYGFCSPTPPVFFSQPTGAFLKPGTNITFRVTAVGSPPLDFRWQKDGTNLVDGGNLSGAGTPNLTITNLIESDSGVYRVVVTNDYGMEISSNALLIVTAVDHFVWNHIPSPQSAGVPFSVRLEARDELNTVATNFNGSCSLAATNVGVTVSPTNCGTFTNGIWSGSLVVSSVATNATLAANDGIGHLGLTNVQIVLAPELGIQSYSNALHLAWTAGALLTLETATNLNPAVWVAVTGAVQVGDQYLMPFDTNRPVQFYRLRY